MHVLGAVELVRQGVEQTVALGKVSLEHGEIWGTKLTIATDLAGIQGIGLEYGKFRRVGPLSSGSHIDRCI